MTENWIYPITIGKIYVGDGNLHDGFVDVHLGTPISSRAVDKLEELLPKKRPTIIDSIASLSSTSLRLVAKPKRDGVKRNEDELRKMAKHAIVSIYAWAKTHSVGDITMYTGNALTEDRILGASATHSDTGADQTD